MKKLPIGISTFSEIVSEGYYYVDKTPYITQLTQAGKYYFLSRPRRFGKSLFVDTLKCAFEGRKELFQGLYLETHWDFEQSHPVLSLSLGRGRVSSLDELNTRNFSLLNDLAETHGIKCHYQLVADRFAELIRGLHKKTGRRVVILVDEYDKPILDNLEDRPRAEQMRDGLKNLYSVLKDSDQHIKFCFLTGVSKFSRVSIFRDLNNLKDISLDPDMGAICGYTQADLEHIFAERLQDVDLDSLAAWYNGYNFLGDQKVYNPFDLLLFFDTGRFGSYWFESATPSFLINLLMHKRFYVPDLEGTEVNESVISSFSIESLLAETVLFQSGYLTIDQVQQLGLRRFYRLCFPNQEVKLGFTDALLAGYTQSTVSLTGVQNRMYQAVRNQDLEEMSTALQALFTSIHYEWYTKNTINAYEGYYCSVVYAFLASLGFDLRPEPSSSHGRADLILISGQVVYVLEFKVVDILGDGQKAITQIKKQGYHQQYMQAGYEVILLGLEFSKQKRNLVGFEYERIERQS